MSEYQYYGFRTVDEDRSSFFGKKINLRFQKWKN